MAQKGCFEEHLKVPISFQDKPEVGDIVWMDRSTGIIYNFDNTRQLWLSTNKTSFEFARKGAADGMFLPLLGDLDAIDDAYVPGNKAIITSVICKSKTGNNEKLFDVFVNGSSVLNFNYDNKRLYVNSNLNILIESEDEVQVYVNKGGSPVRNTSCRVETAWRYDI